MRANTQQPQSIALQIASQSGSAAPSGGNNQANLRSLQESIAAADLHELSNPDSECRMAIDVLVQLAATPGDNGKEARVALADVYMWPIAQEKRHAMLNAAHACTQQKVFCQTGRAELSSAIALMAACAPHPPEGNNGPAHTQARLADLARAVSEEFEVNPQALEQATQPERQARSAALDNLNFAHEPLSLATPAPQVRASLHDVMKDVQANQQPRAVWVVDSDEQCVAVVAEPAENGQVHFHVVSSGDGPGQLVGKTLADIGERECVIHQAKCPLSVLEDANSNATFNNPGGVGAAISNSAAHQASQSPEERNAQELGRRVKSIDEPAVSHSQASSKPAVGLMGSSAKPSVEDDLTKSLSKGAERRAVDGRLGMKKRNFHFNSNFHGLKKWFPVMMKLKDPNLEDEKKKNIQFGMMTKGAPDLLLQGPNGYPQASVDFAFEFNADKAPLLFRDYPQEHPLCFASVISKGLGFAYDLGAVNGRGSVNGLGSGEKLVTSVLARQESLLEQCYKSRNKPDEFRLALREILRYHSTLVGNIDGAIFELEQVQKVKLTDMEEDAQAKEQAKSLVAALNKYRTCLTQSGGNMYADLVALAKEGTTTGEALSEAQERFKSVS